MERDLVRYLCERLPAHPRLLVGPGDDAAILRLPERAHPVATTDMLMTVSILCRGNTTLH
jgi:thiamine monophosphate kinase